MAIILDKVQQLMNNARNCMSAQNVAPEILEACFDPILEQVTSYLIQEAQESEARIKTRQKEYEQLVYQLLEAKKVFAWPRNDTQDAFKKDIQQYEQIILYSIRASSLQMLDWAVSYHISKFGLSKTSQEYKNELAQRKQLKLQSLMSNNSLNRGSINQFCDYFDHLINSRSWLH